MSISQHANMNISKEELLKFSGWKKDSKQFIKNSSNNIDLRIVIKEYQSIVNDFYDWFKKRQKEIFIHEILKVEQIKVKIKESKLELIKLNLLNSNYKTFQNFEKDLYEIISLKENVRLTKLNQIEKTNEIANLFKVNEVTKYIIKEKLQSIIT